jgi:hypothetical protein
MVKVDFGVESVRSTDCHREKLVVFSLVALTS